MRPAHPVDRDDDLAGRIIEIGNRLPGSLSARYASSGERPLRAQYQTDLRSWARVAKQTGPTSTRSRGGSVVIGDALFDRLDMFECAIPACLQFTCDQAVLRVGDIVLTERPIGSETALPQDHVPILHALGHAVREPVPQPPMPPRPATGWTTASSASSTTSSTRSPPKLMQVCS